MTLLKIPIKSVKKPKDSVASQYEDSMTKESVPIIKKIDPDKLVPTGSVRFNLECSGNIGGAFRTGRMVNLIGDSHSGKTALGLTVFAECNKLERFNHYKFIYDDVEHSCDFDLDATVGKSCAERIETDHKSITIEQFSDRIAKLLEGDNPFIYILDSFDALTTEAALEKDGENRKKREKDQEIKGSYGDGKPKAFAQFCSLRIGGLAEQESVLIVISQTRDNIGFGAMFSPKTRSGGKALKFYSALEVWLAVQKKEKDGKRIISTAVQAKITKNKLTGKSGEAYFIILNDYGIDDIKSCIQFLIEEGAWKGTPSSIDTKGFMPPVQDSRKNLKHPSLTKIVDYIEENNLEENLYQLCQETYDDIIEKLRPKRKPKYT